MKNNLRRLWLGLICLAIMTGIGCGECQHEWKAADCDNASICSLCGAVSGEPLGHELEPATCTKEPTCKRCGKKEGNALGHSFLEATCTTPRTCSICNMKDGDPLGHDFEPATCTEPETCKICGEQEGNPLDHQAGNWVITKVATCSEEGIEESICVVCNERMSRKIDKISHVDGNWTITKEATAKTAGSKKLTCKVCGATIRTESYNKSAQEIEKEFKDSCVKAKYDELARTPEQYEGKNIKVTGEVIQVVEAESKDKYCIYRVDITKGKYYYSDTILVTYDGYGKTPRVLKGDIVTIYGTSKGLTSYETVRGDIVTLPKVLAEYITIN